MITYLVTYTLFHFHSLLKSQTISSTRNFDDQDRSPAITDQRYATWKFSINEPYWATEEFFRGLYSNSSFVVTLLMALLYILFLENNGENGKNNRSIFRLMEREKGIEKWRGGGGGGGGGLEHNWSVRDYYPIAS